MDRYGSVDPEVRSLPGAWQVQVCRYLRCLLRNMDCSQAELAEYQSRRLATLVRHAARTVPLYQRLYADSNLSSFHDAEELSRLPTVSKADLIAYGENERLSSLYKRERLIRVSTGGTTGQKLDVLLAPAYAQRRTAEGYRVLVTNGYRPWDRIAILSQRSAQRRWYHRLGMLRQTVVPIAWPIGTQQRELEQERPAFIEGYPSRLHLVADGLSLGYRPKAVLSHSETLAPIVRERLEQVFGISVSNIYETWECGRIAWEFPGSQGLVLGMDSHIVEVLDGEVCVTDLHNYAMPLIRYRTGDQARLSDSGGLRRLDSIDGRISDYLDLPDGTKTPLLVVFHALIRAPGIGGFQLRGRSRDAVTVLIQVAGGYSSRTDQEIRNTLMQRFGFIDVQIEPVEALPRTESGKLRWLVDETQMQKTLLT